jgi:phosphoenolpyruvate carboxykinase (ATP)
VDNSSLSFDTTGRDAYQVSRTVTGPKACVETGLASQLGITNVQTLYRNLTYPELFEHEQANNEGVVARAEYGDTFTVDTGKYTGRSPKDRWIVLNAGSETAENMDWNSINQPTKPEVFDELLDKAVAYFNSRDTAYIFDGYCGANLATRKKIRFVHEMAWQQHFGTFLLYLYVCMHGSQQMHVRYSPLTLLDVSRCSYQHVHSSRNAPRARQL